MNDYEDMMQELAQQDVKPVPEALKLTAEQAVAYFAFDMAIHALTGHASQMKLAGHEDVARVFVAQAEKLAEKRDGWLRRSRTGIVVVGADAMPKPETESQS